MDTSVVVVLVCVSRVLSQLAVLQRIRPGQFCREQNRLRSTGLDYMITVLQVLRGHVMTTNTNEIEGWLRGRLPDGWFTGPAEVTIDREEIQVLGTLAVPEGIEDQPDGPEITEAAHGRISRFREDTRDERIAIAREAEHRFGRKIAWGAECGPVRGVFTNLAVPVMTRLRQAERIVLDTLVEAGVARSRADALAWCVRLVGEHSEDWLSQLREAMTSVQKLREEGPTA
jgi:hypothetical protein